MLNALTTTVSGLAETGAVISLTVNGMGAGQAGAAGGEFHFASAALISGVNALTVIAADALGHAATATGEILRPSYHQERKRARSGANCV